MICDSMDQLIRTSYDEFKDITGIYEKIDGQFVGRTFGEFYTDIRSLSEKLLGMGLQGKNIMIYGCNSYNWMVAYLAITAYVGIVIPIDKEWKTNDINHVLSVIDIDFILYSDCLKENLEGTNGPRANLENETTDLINQGATLDVKRKENQTNNNRVCTIMFTSGTTATPKKIELTERNLVANGHEMGKLFTVSANDRYIVSLPLSHIATILGVFIYPVSMGANMYIPNDFKEMGEDLKLVRPTVFYGVPRIFEKIWEAIPEDKQSQIKKGIKISNLLMKIGIDKRKKIFAEFHKSLGGAVRFAYSGSANIDDELIGIFDDMGLPILQAYGMTETSAIVACDSINHYRLGSVGKVLGNQECKIIEQDETGVGEICVKGNNIAQCAVGDDGYLHTGDLGYLGKDGYLYIVGRKKRMIKLSNAKNVYPDELEELLCQSDIIESAFVYEKDKRIVATVVSSASKTDIDVFISQLNETLPHYKQISEVVIADEIRQKLYEKE